MHERIVQKYINIIDVEDFSPLVIAEALQELPLGDPSNAPRGDGPLNILMNKLIGGAYDVAAQRGEMKPEEVQPLRDAISAGVNTVPEPIARRRRGLLELVARMHEETFDTSQTVDLEICLLTLGRRLVEQNPLNRFTSQTAESDVSLLDMEIEPIAAATMIKGISPGEGKDPVGFLETRLKGLQDLSTSSVEVFGDKAKALLGYEAQQIEGLRVNDAKAMYDKISAQVGTFDAANVANMPETFESAVARQELVRWAMQAKLANADEIAATHYPKAVDVFVEQKAIGNLNNVRDRLSILLGSPNVTYQGIGNQLMQKIAVALEPAGMEGM